MARERSKNVIVRQFVLIGPAVHLAMELGAMIC